MPKFIDFSIVENWIIEKADIGGAGLELEMDLQEAKFQTQRAETCQVFGKFD
jgi:hypothetical protein